MEAEDIASSQLSDSLCRLLQALKDNNMMSPQLVISVYNCIEQIDITAELRIEFIYVYLTVFQNNLSRYENNCDDEAVRREFDAYFRIFVNWLGRELSEK